MFEQENLSDPNYQYDSTVHHVTVVVDENMKVTITYDGEPDVPTFNNVLKKYRLPDTGGHGPLPYYLGGTVLLAASVLLFIRKRREDA
jgi:LPXTG-motif cell wall-anchored protein